MDFDSRPWLFLLFVVPGLWLAWRLYGNPRRSGLLVLYALAWILIGVLAVSPRWRFRSETWHAPLVVLAVDQSGSYAALGAQASARASVDAARRHYEALGFKVREIGFGQDLHREVGGATNLPNLQAVIVWTDGRFRASGSGEWEGDAVSWPAPVFPVIVNPEGSEVQGERAELDFAPEGDAGVAASTNPLLTVEWRSVGTVKHGAAHADLELLAGRNVVWKTALIEPPGTRPGERVVAHLQVPETVKAQSLRSDPALWRVLVRPGASGNAPANRYPDNDSLTLVVRGKNLATRLIIRPLATLEERGLADALRASGQSRVLAVEAASLSTVLSQSRAPSVSAAAAGSRDVVWLRAGSSAFPAVREAASRAGVPLIRYTLDAGETKGGAEGFSADARVVWRADGAEFLPAGVLRLGDLGVAEDGRMRNPGAPDTSREALAWVEENGRRGLLFWRVRGDGTFGCAVPPLWRAAFSPNVSAGSGTQELPAQWMGGLSDWSRVAASRRPPQSGKPRSIVASPELALLGNDLETLRGVAAASNGKTINSSSNDLNKYEWPALPGGQMRARSTRSIPLAPPVANALAIAVSLAVVWALRKRLRLD